MSNLSSGYSGPPTMIVGHSHNRQDQHFAVACATLNRSHNLPMENETDFADAPSSDEETVQLAEHSWSSYPMQPASCILVSGDPRPTQPAPASQPLSGYSWQQSGTVPASLAGSSCYSWYWLAGELLAAADSDSVAPASWLILIQNYFSEFCYSWNNLQCMYLQC